MSLDQYTRSDGVVGFLRDRGLNLPRVVFLVPLLGITISETLLYFGYTYYSLSGHVVTLLVCVLGPLRLKRATPVFQAFALVSVFRLVNLGMPVFFKLTIFWFPLIYAPLIPAIYQVSRTQETVLKPGWKIAVLALPLAVPISAALGYVEFTIIEPNALVPEWSISQLALITVVMVGFVGFVEELLFRGVLQRVLQKRVGRWLGLGIASAVFGLMHSGYSVPFEIVFAGTIGLVFGVVYDMTDSLVLISVMHGLLNVFLFAVFPLIGLGFIPQGVMSAVAAVGA